MVIQQQKPLSISPNFKFINYSQKKIYVYSDAGASRESVSGWIKTLRRYTTETTIIRTTTGRSLISDLLAQSPHNTILVMPGGADMPYVRALDGPPTHCIRDVVKRGAVYIGSCAGAYFASVACIFEPNDPKLRVVGSRALALFPFPAIGAARPGFAYNSQAGATFETLLLCNNHINSNRSNNKEDNNRHNQQHHHNDNNSSCNNPNLTSILKYQQAKVYCNGGPAWPYVTETVEKDGQHKDVVCDINCDNHSKDEIQILARYTSPVLERHGIYEQNPSAVVSRTLGKGMVVLCGVHPEMTPYEQSEFAGTNLLLRMMLTAARLIKAN